MLQKAMPKPRRSFGVKYGRDIIAWLIMLPGVILFLFFVWEPLLESIPLSLYETKGVQYVRFTGLDIYRRVLAHPDFLFALRNTFFYTLWSLVIGFLVPIGLAVLIQEMVYGKSLFRVAAYLPNMVPGLATVFLWRYIFSGEPGGGLNMLCAFLGLPTSQWLANPSLAIPLIVVTMTWKGAGATMLIYLAGLQSINPELYEAAIIDGANVRRRIWHITIPQLYNLGRTLLILQIIAVFQVQYEPIVMTGGGPNNASISLMQVVFRYAFTDYRYSEATAVSVIISAILLVLTFVNNKLIKPKDM